MRVVCVLLKDSKNVKFLAECCLRYSPQIALGENWFFIEIGACQRLYSEQNFFLRLQALLKKFEISAKIGVAGDLPTALASAVYGNKKKDLLPVDAIPFYFNPFEKEEHFLKTVEILKKLAIYDLKKLLDIPPGFLTSKFDKDVSLAIRRVNDATHIPWPRFVPEEVVEESYEFLETQLVNNLEPLLFVLKGLLDRVCLRLRGRGYLISKMQIQFELEKYSTVKESLRAQEIELAFPQSSVQNLLAITRERLEKEFSSRPIESEVKKVSLKILEKVPGSYRQKDFFSQKEEEMEAFESLVSAVSDKLGIDKIFYAQPLESYFPERSWQKALTPSGSFTVELPERPSRVLPTPLRLSRIGEYFVFHNRRWRISSMEGPERISGQWWNKEGERDYFKVHADSGEDLWVYQPENTGEYFLHGIYD